jgi:hypothetical protein
MGDDQARGAKVGAVAVGVPRAAGGVAVHRRRRHLEGPRVVDGVARAGRELRVDEGCDTAARITRTLEVPPGIVDEAADVLTGARLRPDAHHLDAGDEAPLVLGPIALTGAESRRAIRAQR